MRTTLDIDDDVLAATRELATREGKSMGALLSELARRALTAPVPQFGVEEPTGPYGLRSFASRAAIVTNEMIDKIREEDAY